MLNDPSIAHSVDVHMVDGKAASTRREHTNGRVFECSRVGAAAGDSVDHGVSAYNFIFNIESKIRRLIHKECSVKLLRWIVCGSKPDFDRDTRACHA